MHETGRCRMRVETPMDLTGDMERKGAGNTSKANQHFRLVVEEIANQVCMTIGGNFDHLVRVDAQDETIEKLEMVVNFVLATASRSIEEVKQAKAQLEQQLDIRRK